MGEHHGCANKVLSSAQIPAGLCWAALFTFCAGPPEGVEAFLAFSLANRLCINHSEAKPDLHTKSKMA